MDYQLVIPKKVEKELEKINKPHKLRILAVLNDLRKNPFIGKKLKGKYKGQYSYKVWPYRIIYEIYQKKLIILIIHIGHRQGTY